MTAGGEAGGGGFHLEVLTFFVVFFVFIFFVESEAYDLSVTV
jgi:hypothetical protein